MISWRFGDPAARRPSIADQDVAHFQDERRLVHSILSQIMEPEIVPLTSVLLRLVGRGDQQYALWIDCNMSSSTTQTMQTVRAPLLNIRAT